MSDLLGEPGARFECLASDVQIGQFAAGLLEVADLLMEAMDDPEPASRADTVVGAIDVLYQDLEPVYAERNGYFREIVFRQCDEKRARKAEEKGGE